LSLPLLALEFVDDDVDGAPAHHGAALLHLAFAKAEAFQDPS
jgi:hypothetical protein